MITRAKATSKTKVKKQNNYKGSPTGLKPAGRGGKLKPAGTRTRSGYKARG